jgi:hypothetical protein
MEVSGICCEPTYLIVKPEYKVVRTRLLDLGFPRKEVLCSFEGVIHLDGADVGISSLLEWPRDSLHTSKIQIAKHI